MQLHDRTLAAASGLTRILRPLHLGNYELKGLLYVLVVARAGFGPGTFELCGEGATVFGPVEAAPQTSPTGGGDAEPAGDTSVEVQRKRPRKTGSSRRVAAE